MSRSHVVSSGSHNSNVGDSSSQNLYQVLRSGHHHQIHDNGTFRIPETTTNDSGEYSCVAFNGIGPGISRVVHLTVTRKYLLHDCLK